MIALAIAPAKEQRGSQNQRGPKGYRDIDGTDIVADAINSD